MREKAMGYMWEGEMEAKLNDGITIIFNFWHHFHYDDGGKWCPPKEQLDAAWRAKFVPEDRSPTAQLRDASWHTIYEADHVYISKEGTFDGKRNKEEIRRKITDGSWEQDPDLWMLI